MNHNTGKVRLSSLSRKDAKWDSKKSMSRRVSAIYADSAFFESRAAKVSCCSNWLEFGRSKAKKLKLLSASFCRLRLCPICMWRRAAMWRIKFNDAMPEFFYRYPNYGFIFLTLTVRNCSVYELSDTLTLMNQAFNRMKTLKAWQKAFKGFIRTTEVTRSDDGSAHPHFHLLLAVNNKTYYKGTEYLSKAKLIEFWRRSMRLDYDPSIWVERVKESADRNLSGAVMDTLKYCAKVDKDTLSDADFFLELSKQLHGKRFISSGGVLKNILREDDQDLLNAHRYSVDEMRRAGSLFFQWHDDLKHYFLDEGLPD